MVNACNDELCTLLMEVVFIKGENGNDFIGIRSNIDSETNDFTDICMDGFGFLNLGLKRTKDSHEIRGMSTKYSPYYN